MPPKPLMSINTPYLKYPNIACIAGINLPTVKKLNMHQLTRWKSGMQLCVDSNAAYLVMPGAKSCFSGYFYLASKPHSLNYNIALHNAPILVECCALKNAICSATEAECGGLFHNAQLAVMICAILQAIGHPQGPKIQNS
eukprot:2998866-Ditylum_brightwellii.AAC.1